MGLFSSIRLGSSGAGDYEVERSLKFNADDTVYLERTPSSNGNKRTWTFSTWIKRSKLTALQTFFSAGSNNPDVIIKFTPSDQFEISRYGGGYQTQVTSTHKFRDPSAWYHLVGAVDTTQSTASNRVKMYVNGTQITDFAISSYPSQDYEYPEINDTGFSTKVGKHGSNSQNFDGYMSEVHFIDGLQLTPSSFAETDDVTGEWKPKKYVGSYGTNGFKLTFSDNSGTTDTTLGKDSSGNGNNLTPYNFSVAAGVGNDSLTDTPTNNFCTFNPLKVNPSAPIVFKEGNLEHNGVSGNNHLRSATTMQVTSGKWYVEFKFISGYETANGTVGFGICTDAAHRDSNNDAAWYENSNNFLALQYRNDGEIVRSEAATSTDDLTGLSTFANGDVMGLALDLDNDKFFVSKNGTWFSNGTGTQDPANGTNPLYSGGVLTSRKSDGFYFNISGYSAQVVAADFGQHGYAYTPPTGFKKVCTANFPDPSIAKPNQHFNTLLYTGNDSSDRDITGVGFQPDLLWIKNRSQTDWHMVQDSVRGANKVLYSNTTDGEDTDNTNGHVNSFLADGFNVDAGASGNVNENNENYVAWNWYAGGSTVTNNDGSRTAQVRANPTAGFSIVTSTSGGSSDGTYDSFGHGLGVAPDIILFKNRDIGDNWSVYNSNFSNAYTKILQFNTIDETTSTNHWGTANPTSTTFSLNQASVFNSAGEDLVAYCFSEVAGYSKFGTYVGVDNANGIFVHTGFKPAFVMIKRLEGGYSWYMLDNKRDPINPIHENLYANDNIATYDYSMGDLLSNGFKLRNTGTDTNKVDDHIFLAFAESPFKYTRAR